MENWKSRRKLRRLKKRMGTVSESFDGIKRIAFLSKILFWGFIAGILFLVVIIPILTFTLPSPEKIVRNEGFSTKILDRNGKVLYDVYKDQKRIPVELSDISDSLKKATVSIEDKNFYVHQGFDIFGMIRGFSRLVTRGRAQGGSTLTQQLVKNVLLTSERSVLRKIKEFMLAVQIERKYSKDDILKMYLNEAPYGGAVYGVEAASETYFGKSASELNLLESAVLAGIPQRPSYYSPYSSSNPESYKDRTKQVLRRMREDGHITEEEEEKEIENLDSLKIQERGASFKSPHFVLYVQKLLEERYGESIIETGGLKVTTTLDLELQESAQNIVSEEIKKVEAVHITNGASIVLDPQTGEILAMVGSKDFSASDYDGQVNVTLSLRQPGSAIKPITYAAAIQKGYKASTLFMDVPTKFYAGIGQPDYEPKNYDGKYRGPIQLRYALGNSINIPAVKMISMIGVRDVLSLAYDMGMDSLKPTKENMDRVGLSLTLGGGEVRLIDLTRAYSVFLNQGYKIEAQAILKIEDRNGKTLEENKPQKTKKILSPEEAFIIADILSDNEARKDVFGLNSLLNISGRQIAVKTGTTNDKRDNWTIGGNQQVVVGVWVGNNDNSPMKEVASGVSGASPIWRKILLEGLKGKSPINFETPGGIVTVAVDTISGFKAHDGFPSRIEKFIDGTQPTEDTTHLKLKVCKSDGKLATPADIQNGNYDEKEYFVFKEKDPNPKDKNDNWWQDGINIWLATQGDSRYHPPSDYCGTSNPISVDFISPNNESSNLSNDITVEVKADSTNNIIEVILEADGQRVISFTGRPYKYIINLSNGIHTLKVKARDDKNYEAEKTITIGVNTNWYTPTPTQSPTPMQTLSATPTNP